MPFPGLSEQERRDLLEKYFSDSGDLPIFRQADLDLLLCHGRGVAGGAGRGMFVDNHVGGSFYPAGSTLFLPGKLEKVIEENAANADGREAVSILFEQNRPAAVLLDDNSVLGHPTWSIRERSGTCTGC
jgi:prolycopene isomerase